MSAGVAHERRSGIRAGRADRLVGRRRRRLERLEPPGAPVDDADRPRPRIERRGLEDDVVGGELRTFVARPPAGYVSLVPARRSRTSTASSAPSSPTDGPGDEARARHRQRVALRRRQLDQPVAVEQIGVADTARDRHDPTVVGDDERRADVSQRSPASARSPRPDHRPSRRRRSDRPARSRTRTAPPAGRDRARAARR